MGRRLYAGIKAMVEGKALRIVERLQDVAREHQYSTQLQLGRDLAIARTKLYAHELNAVVAPATAIRPLEKIYAARRDRTHECVIGRFAMRQSGECQLGTYTNQSRMRSVDTVHSRSALVGSSAHSLTP